MSPRLAGDYEAYLVDNEKPVWAESDSRHQTVSALQWDGFTATEDAPYLFSLHLIAMRKRFAPWLENGDALTAANAILVIIQRAESLLVKQMEKLGGTFLEEGGFRERMTRLRMEQRDAAQTAKASEPPPPACPACGKPMTLRKAKSGPNAGKPFWGCSGYPACKAIQDVEG